VSVFTVYCHGTGFNRVKGTSSNELVAWFHNHNAGVEASLEATLATRGDYLINEGPGHGGGGIAQPQQINAITGSSKTNRPKKSVSVLGHSFKTPLRKTPDFLDHVAGTTDGPERAAKVRGLIGGHGWDENTIRTVNLIQDLKFGKGQPIDTVNLVGWSRGAVTCMRIANLMWEVFSDEITCNIFAVDPVAGADAGEKMTDTQKLEANVENYVGILAMHEMRGTFKPQDWSRVRAPGTTCIFLPMPGVHNAQVIPGNPVDAAHITRNLACGLLRDWGTPLTAVPYSHLSSSRDMCIAYARLVLALSEHKSYETKSLKGRLGGGTTSLRRRDFATHSKMDTYTRGGKESYWINEHHRACFADAFPDVYDAIFESSGSGEVALTAQSKFATFYGAVSGSTPLRQSLSAKGLLAEEAGNKYYVGIGTGRYANQVRCEWPDDWPLTA
jgi:hypothetical protein